jgi:hypothetical protein
LELRLGVNVISHCIEHYSVKILLELLVFILVDLDFLDEMVLWWLELSAILVHSQHVRTEIILGPALVLDVLVLKQVVLETLCFLDKKFKEMLVKPFFSLSLARLRGERLVGLWYLCIEFLLDSDWFSDKLQKDSE